VSSPNITFIGAGNMASSIIGGLVAKGYEASNITASDPYEESLTKLKNVAPVNTTNDNNQAIANADIVVLAVKPQTMKAVLQELAAVAQAKKPLIISIAAGITSNSIDQWLGGNMSIVRCMPNTPSLVQAGATALHANALVNDRQRNHADNILAAVGTILWVEDEAALDAVTAVSGSGPAYYFLVMEAMQAAGEALGLSSEQAKQLTLQTALGAAKIAQASDVDAAELRRRVCSPGGTTIEAINIFEQEGLRDTFMRAMTACKNRSEQLAKELAD
jgi:pyrroline-5-carboxylate reductase